MQPVRGDAVVWRRLKSAGQIWTSTVGLWRNSLAPEDLNGNTVRFSVPVELNFLGGLQVERKSQMQPNPRSLGALQDYSQDLELYLVINGALAECVELTMALYSNTPNTKKNEVYHLDEHLLGLVEGKQGRVKAVEEKHMKLVFLSHLEG